MDIICVDKPSTFPPLLRHAIAEKQIVLDFYIRQVREQSDTGIRGALEYYYVNSDNELNELLEKVQTILEDCFFEGFHNTRVIRKRSDIVIA